MKDSNKASSHLDEIPDNGLPSDIESLLESTIRSAANYVVPSDKLRPQILESARERFSDLRIERLYLRYACVLFVLVCFCTSILRWGSPFNQLTSKEIEERAIQVANDQHMEVEWGLVEVVSHLRRGSFTPNFVGRD
jgi:hypothetical protein